MVSRVLYPNEVACADPDKCREICENPGGCTNIAYPLLVVRNMPDGMRGLMLAAMLAALMSSLTSIFNSASSVFTLDIWKKAIRKKAEERELMVVGRVYTLILVGVSVAWLPILQAVQGSEFWHYVQEILSHILPSIVCAFVLGLFWTRATEKSAFWSLVICTVIGLTRLILSWVNPAPPCGSSEPDTTWPIISDVHYLHFAMILFVIAFFLQVFISLMTEPRHPSKLHRVTFWTRNDPELMELSDDEFEDCEEDEEEMINMDSATEKLNMAEEEAEVEDKNGGLISCIKKYTCGIESVKTRKMTKKQFLEMLHSISDISEDPKLKKIVNVNAVICVGVAIFLHAFWG